MLLVYIQSKSAVTSFKIRAVLSNTADYLEKLCSVTLIVCIILFQVFILGR